MGIWSASASDIAFAVASTLWEFPSQHSMLAGSLSTPHCLKQCTRALALDYHKHDHNSVLYGRCLLLFLVYLFSYLGSVHV